MNQEEEHKVLIQFRAKYDESMMWYEVVKESVWDTFWDKCKDKYCAYLDIEGRGEYSFSWEEVRTDETTDQNLIEAFESVVRFMKQRRDIDAAVEQYIEENE